jgi:hypothetical protein
MVNIRWFSVEDILDAMLSSDSDVRIRRKSSFGLKEVTPLDL